MSQLRDALLEAHVEFEMARLCGPGLDAELEARVASAFQWFRDVALKEVVQSEQILEVIDRYVIQLKVSGGITELAGQMANVVFSSKSADATLVSEVCDPDDYQEFADKIVGLTGVQRELIRYLVRSSSFATLASRMLSRMATDLLFQSDATGVNPLTGLVSAVGRRIVPRLERHVGAALSRYAERHAERLTKAGEAHLCEVLDPEWIRQMADEIWDVVSEKSLSEAVSVFDEQDLEDFVVLGYEFWLKFRQTAYFKAVSTEVVDRLFAKYGEESVFSVIEDMGVTEQMVVHEVRAFLPPLLEHARRTGFLEQEIRAHLVPFYESPAVAAILAR